MAVMSGFLNQGENMFQTDCSGKYLDIRGLKVNCQFLCCYMTSHLVIYIRYRILLKYWYEGGCDGFNVGDMK